MKRYITIVVITTCILYSCEKDWLDEKRDIKLIVPQNLADLRLLMNNNDVLNKDFVGIGEVASGDFYLTTENWNTVEYQPEKLAYNWQNPFISRSSILEWDGSYKQIEICNVVLDALKKIPLDEYNRIEYNDLKGSALFYRAKAYFNLAQIFAPVYSSDNLQKPGIPLRKSSDANEKIARSSIADTYSEILVELKEAVSLVRTTPAYKTDPSKATVYGFLARCYLAQSDFVNAKLNADSCLMLYNKLIDYNTLNATALRPFPALGDEVIHHSTNEGNYASFYYPYGIIQADIASQFESNDIRKQVYFRNNQDGTYSMKGFYSGFRTSFTGVSTDEIYLIRAETQARLGNVTGAMNDLNAVLMQRYKTGTYLPFSATNSLEALNIVLIERRKELLIRGVRWTDLRRLNLEPGRSVKLVRTLNSQTFELMPNDYRYVFPLPDYVVSDYGLQQNQGWQ